MAIDYNTGISSLEAGAGEITYSGNEGPKSPDQMLMAQADPILVEEYKKYVFEMEEMGQQPMSFKQFMQQAMQGMAYGGTVKPTYTQSRKQNLAYGGIAGLDGRKRYGIGSWIQEKKDKFIDDIIPNEIKENPMLSSIIAGTLLNQYGVPFTDKIEGLDKNIGKGWFSDLVKAGSDMPVIGPAVKTVGDVAGGIGNIIKGPDDKWLGTDILGLPGRIKSGISGILPEGLTDTLFGPSTIDGKEVQWKIPLGIGMSMGALQDKMPKAKLPADTSSIDMAAAKRGDDLRFKPDASVLAADGGRIGYDTGNSVINYNEDPEYKGWKKMYEMNPDVASMHANHGTYLNFYNAQGQAQGGRIGYAGGRNEYLKRLEHLMFLGYDYDNAKEIAQDDDKYQIESTRGLGNAQGGRIGAQEGGLMDLGGMEKDYRNEGGFVPIGGQERADDVPARLSKNEFVFTADAVRSAGGGDIDKGAEVMENVMENLERGGQISQESQGLEGARNMFATAQRLEGVL